MRQHCIILGDIHGRLQELKSLKIYLQSNKSLPQPEEATIIFLGDLGANFYYLDPNSAYRDVKFKQGLEKLGFEYYCLRGNHEQRPSYMKGLFQDAWEYVYDEDIKGNIYVEKEFPDIKYLEDSPAVYEFLGHKTLIFPGAYSVDKQYRLAHGWNYFRAEQLDEGEMDLGRDLARDKGPFELILSHTCPTIYIPTDLFLSFVDQSTVDHTMERYLNEIEMNLDYRLWLFAHYHDTRVYPKYGEKQCIMLFNTAYLDLNEYFLNEEQPHDALHIFNYNEWKTKE